MKIYHYSKDTGEFVSDSEARPDPLEKDKYLIPANAITEAPPETKSGEVAVYNGGWTVVENHRGKKVYSTTSDDELEIKELGPLPEGYTETAKPGDDYEWDGKQWAKKSAEVLLQEKRKVSLPRMDFMLTLKKAGYYLKAKRYAESLEEDHDWRIMWETAQSFSRMTPELIAGAKELGLTDTHLDALFGI